MSAGEEGHRDGARREGARGCGEVYQTLNLTCSSSPGCIYTAGPAALSAQCSKLTREGRSEILTQRTCMNFDLKAA